MTIKELQKKHPEWFQKPVNKKKGLTLREVKKQHIYYREYFLGWYIYLIDEKFTLCNSFGEIIIDNVDRCYVYANYYEYIINGEWYEKNFDGSEYKGEWDEKKK